MSQTLLLAIGLQHFVFDWLLQPRWMGERKSESLWILTIHILIVSCGLALVAAIFHGSVAWVVANSLLHFATDFVTSRISKWAWNSDRKWLAFTVIGADQWLLHYPAMIIGCGVLC